MAKGSSFSPESSESFSGVLTEPIKNPYACKGRKRAVNGDVSKRKKRLMGFLCRFLKRKESAKSTR